MKKILILFASIVVLTSCQDLTDLNTDPKRSSVAPAGSLFASAQKNMVDNLASSNVNLNIFRLLSQQWTETTYTDESNYDLGTRTIPDQWWQAFYRDVIQDLREAREIAEADETLDPAVLANQIAMIEIMEVHAWAILVDTFGNIPYEDAMNVNATPDDILLPVYNDAEGIYTDLIARLNTALGELDNSAESWGEDDLIYGGDVDSWTKLGNSIKLRMGMMLADVNPTAAQTAVTSAAPNVFASNADNAIFLYKSAPPNTNPIWVDLVQSGRKDFVGANTFVDAMLEYTDGTADMPYDPRMPFYFTEDAGGDYSGGIYGASNNYAAYSKPGDIVDNSDFPHLLMDYAEVQFLLAEARERGWTWTDADDAEDYYNAAITASMEYWGVEPADITAYLALPEVAYATAEGDPMNAIAKQKWLALYNRGFEAWTEWRRLDYPVLVAPPDAFSDIPLRFTYPISEQNLNTINYDDAVAAMGEDDVDVPIFWDEVD